MVTSEMVEESLTGKSLCLETLKPAVRHVEEAVSPIDDIRASADTVEPSRGRFSCDWSIRRLGEMGFYFAPVCIKPVFLNVQPIKSHNMVTNGSGSVAPAKAGEQKSRDRQDRGARVPACAGTAAVAPDAAAQFLTPSHFVDFHL